MSVNAGFKSGADARRGFGNSQRWVGKFSKLSGEGDNQRGRIVGEKRIEIAPELDHSKPPDFLPEIKPAQQTAQTR